MTTDVDSVTLHLSRQELALERKQAELRRTNALEFFTPHPRQNLFFANASPCHFRYARTGNRFGKSEMGAAEDVAFAIGYRPWYPIGDPRRTLGIPSHATKGLIITTDWDKSTEVFTSEEDGVNKGKLFKYIPTAAFIGHSRNHSGAIDCIRVRHISGSTSLIYLDTVKSFKQNPMGQESSAWDWVHIDEPIPEAMWKAVSRGLVDRNGRAWFTCTPITEPWIDGKFCPNLEDQNKETFDSFSIAESDRWMMTGSMDDNPHNSPEAIARYMADLTPEEQEARRNGIPLAYSGIVYKEFNWTTHVRKEPPKGWSAWDCPPPDHCIWIANDYHFRKNNATLFIAVPPDGPAVVYHEIWKSLLIDEEVAEIKAVLRGRTYQPIVMDPLASTPNKVNDLTAMDEYRRRGLAVLPATKDPANGIRAVKALFKARGKQGEPCLIVASHLARFLFEVSRGFVHDPDPNVDKPLKENDDMMECLYRLVLQGLRYIEPSELSDYTPIPQREIPANVLDWDFGPKDRVTTPLHATRYRA